MRRDCTGWGCTHSRIQLPHSSKAHGFNHRSYQVRSWFPRLLCFSNSTFTRFKFDLYQFQLVPLQLGRETGLSVSFVHLSTGRYGWKPPPAAMRRDDFEVELSVALLHPFVKKPSKSSFFHFSPSWLALLSHTDSHFFDILQWKHIQLMAARPVWWSM